MQKKLITALIKSNIQDKKTADKLIDEFKRHFPRGAPSLVECEKLLVEGDVYFGDNVKIVGSKTIATDGTKTIPDGSVLKG